MTTTEFTNLRKTNPDKFFNDIIQAFHGVMSAGGDITGLFGDLGIKSVRDIQVYERLANGFDIVTSSLQNANKAYADGTYLESSFAAVNDTVSAKAQKVSDAYQNLLASIGQSDVLQGVVKGVLDTVGRLLDLLDKLPSSVKVGISSFVIMLGVFAAYKAAMAPG